MGMFKNQISFMVAMSIFASTTIPQSARALEVNDYKMEIKTSKDEKIATAFNKFRYDMTVEWDQQDSNFKELAQKELEDTLVKLSQVGVTADDMITCF